MDILLCTDGSKSSIVSAQLVLKLGFAPPIQITVLGVSESKSDLELLRSAMDAIDKELSGKCLITRKVRYGNPVDEIMAEAVESPYDLVVLGGGGDQLDILRPQLGATTSKLARKLHTHFLVVRNIPDKLDKILVCAGTDAPASETLALGGTWIANTPAQIGLLHVAQPKTEESVNLSKGEKANLEQIKKEQPSTDLILDRAVKVMQAAGMKNEIIPLVRHGLVVEEVLNELSKGKYGLLVVGAHYQPGQDRWLGTLLDDVTDQLLNRSTCSMLII